MSTLTWIDWAVIGGYFALLFGLAWWVILHNRDTADDYFLAGRNLSWWIIGGSIFASNIGSEHLVGLAGSGATDGVAMAHYELHAWCLLVLAWVLVPFYMRFKVFTMPEFLERRFNPTSRWVLSLITLVAPEPASPTRCSEPMLEAKIEAPTTNQPRLRLARK
jgi:SSS family solute:Na+ symporter